MSKDELLRKLTVGAIVPVDVKSGDGRYLVRCGAVLTEGLIFKLRRWLNRPDVTLERPRIDASITDEALMQSTAQDLKAAFSAPLAEISGVIHHLEQDIHEMAERLEGNTEWTYEDDPHYYHKSTNSEHYVRVAKLSIVLANIYNQGVTDDKKINLDHVAMAAIMQNYGKRFENDEAALRNYSLDATLVKKLDIPTNLLRMPYDNDFHPVYAYVSLAEFLPKSVRTTIMLCKFRDDFGKKYDPTDPCVRAAKIINLCEIYDILLEKVISENMSVPLENVLSYMAQLAHEGTLSPDVFKFFLQHVPAFKTGCKVKLSNGETAVVVSSEPAHRTKPTVLTLPNRGTPHLIELADRTDIVIESIIHENTAHDKVSEFVSGQIDDIKVEATPLEPAINGLPDIPDEKKSRFLKRLKKVITQATSSGPDQSESSRKKR